MECKGPLHIFSFLTLNEKRARLGSLLIRNYMTQKLELVHGVSFTACFKRIFTREILFVRITDV